MQQQQHSQQKSTTQGTVKRSQKISPTRIIIIIITVILLLTATTIWILSALTIVAPVWATIISSILTALGVIFAFGQWFIPVPSSNEAESTLADSSLPSELQTALISLSSSISEQVPGNKLAYRRILSVPPPTDPKAVQQRESLVKEVSAKLVQPDTTAIVITGIGGVGKSTLAALIYKHIEEQRRNEKGPFQAESLWLRIDKNTTFLDLAGTLFDALGKPLPDFNQLAPSNQVLTLFNALKTIDVPCFVVLDQFESLLKWETAQALPERPGIGEFIDALNSQQCNCRFLLTSHIRPKGLYEYPPNHMHEYADAGLTAREGIDLLQNQGVEAPETDLRTAVESCGGHALALTLLASILRRDTSLQLAVLVRNPLYIRLWRGDIARNLLNYIYRELLDKLQRELVLAFSIYREAVPLEAAKSVLTNFRFSEIPEPQIVDALNVLLTQHLLQVTTEGGYQLHALVAQYAQDHFVEDNDQANNYALRTAHMEAARFYEKNGLDDDLHTLVEMIWHLCRANLWREAYDLMEQRGIFLRLKRSAGNAILMELYQMLLPLDRWQPDIFQEVEIYKQLGIIYRDRGKMEEARAYFQQALSAMEKYISISGESGLKIRHLAEIYKEMGETEAALTFYSKALLDANRNNDQFWQAMILQDLALLHISIGKKEESAKFYKDALNVFRQLGAHLSEGVMLKALGDVYTGLGQRESARGYYEDALAIFGMLGDLSWKGIVLLSLGDLYVSMREKEKALTCYQQALGVFRAIEDRQSEGLVLNSLGQFYLDLEKKKEALEYYNSALEIFRELGAFLYEGMILKNIGHLSLSIEQPEEALQSYKKALLCFKAAGNRLWEGRSLHYLSQCSMNVHRFDEAYIYVRGIYLCEGSIEYFART